MKGKILRFLACLFILISILAIGGCGDNGSSSGSGAGVSGTGK